MMPGGMASSQCSDPARKRSASPSGASASGRSFAGPSFARTSGGRISNWARAATGAVTRMRKRSEVRLWLLNTQPVRQPGVITTAREDVRESTSRPANLVQHRQQIRPEALRMLAHRKVTELLHDRDAGARDPRRGLARVVGGAREVVLARQEIKGAARRVDAADAVPKVALGPVEVEVAAEDARSALGVQPERLPPGLGRRLRRDEPRHQRAGELAPMHVWTMKPGGVVVPGRLVGGGLQPHQRAEALMYTD